jgi:CRISPR-associated protein Cas5h
MDVLSFRWRARFGHFLRAEANVNALSYPLPPRTAVLGLLGAIAGLPKDRPGVLLHDALVSIGGVVPRRFWHRVKLRKDPPAALPLTVKKQQKGSDTPEKAALIRQEWLLDPDFLVHLALPRQPQLFAELVGRIRQRRWHFSPCMGLSELLAEVEFVACRPAQALASGSYLIAGICPADRVALGRAEGRGIQLLRMPHSVDEDRCFRHVAYYLEHQGRPFAVSTADAYRLGTDAADVVMFS